VQSEKRGSPDGVSRNPEVPLTKQIVCQTLSIATESTERNYTRG
jgi:hypothetical protein